MNTSAETYRSILPSPSLGDSEPSYRGPECTGLQILPAFKFLKLSDYFHLHLISLSGVGRLCDVLKPSLKRKY